MAKNDVGSSDELSVTFDVLYRPKNVDIRPKRLIGKCLFFYDVRKNNVFKKSILILLGAKLPGTPPHY